MQIPTADRFPKELQTTISLTRDVTGTKAKLYAKYITHVLPLGMFILFGVISLFLEEAAGGWKWSTQQGNEWKNEKKQDKPKWT